MAAISRFQCSRRALGANHEIAPHSVFFRSLLSGIPYEKWRDYDAEDSIRFYALRMHEAGIIKSSPQKIIAENTDCSRTNSNAS
jgi:hypothetical protein